MQLKMIQMDKVDSKAMDDIALDKLHPIRTNKIRSIVCNLMFFSVNLAQLDVNVNGTSKESLMSKFKRGPLWPKMVLCLCLLSLVSISLTLHGHYRQDYCYLHKQTVKHARETNNVEVIKLYGGQEQLNKVEAILDRRLEEARIYLDKVGDPLRWLDGHNLFTIEPLYVFWILLCLVIYIYGMIFFKFNKCDVFLYDLLRDPHKEQIRLNQVTREVVNESLAARYSIIRNDFSFIKFWMEQDPVLGRSLIENDAFITHVKLIAFNYIRSSKCLIRMAVRGNFQLISRTSDFVDRIVFVCFIIHISILNVVVVALILGFFALKHLGLWLSFASMDIIVFSALLILLMVVNIVGAFYVTQNSFVAIDRIRLVDNVRNLIDAHIKENASNIARVALGNSLTDFFKPNDAVKSCMSNRLAAILIHHKLLVRQIVASQGQLGFVVTGGTCLTCLMPLCGWLHAQYLESQVRTYAAIAATLVALFTNISYFPLILLSKKAFRLELDLSRLLAHTIQLNTTWSNPIFDDHSVSVLRQEAANWGRTLFRSASIRAHESSGLNKINSHLLRLHFWVVFMILSIMFTNQMTSNRVLAHILRDPLGMFRIDFV